MQNKRWVIAGRWTAATAVAAALALGCGSRQQPEPPSVGGQPVPSKTFDVDFSKRYDLICSAQGGAPLVYRDCRILGFTGEKSEASGSYGGKNGYFESWLVLELPDRRLAYITPGEVRAFEETAGLKPRP